MFCIVFSHFITMGVMARERNYPGSRPSSSGDLSDLLDGVELNLLDSKLIGIGFVREELVEEVCLRATRQLVREGEGRARQEINNIERQVFDSPAAWFDFECRCHNWQTHVAVSW